MTPGRFKQGREKLGQSQAQLATTFDLKSDRTVRKWEQGDDPVTGPAGVLMGILAFDEWPEMPAVGRAGKVGARRKD